MSAEQQSVSLPAELYKAIEVRIAETEFRSVEEYVVFVLEEVLKDEEDDEIPFSAEDEEEVKKRLRALGYLD